MTKLGVHTSKKEKAVAAQQATADDLERGPADTSSNSGSNGGGGGSDDDLSAGHSAYHQQVTPTSAASQLNRDSSQAPMLQGRSSSEVSQYSTYSDDGQYTPPKTLPTMAALPPMIAPAGDTANRQALFPVNEFTTAIANSEHAQAPRA